MLFIDFNLDEFTKNMYFILWIHISMWLNSIRIASDPIARVMFRQRNFDTDRHLNHCYLSYYCNTDAPAGKQLLTQYVTQNRVHHRSANITTKISLNQKIKHALFLHQPCICKLRFASHISWKKKESSGFSATGSSVKFWGCCRNIAALIRSRTQDKGLNNFDASQTSESIKSKQEFIHFSKKVVLLQFCTMETFDLMLLQLQLVYAWHLQSCSKGL